jgi:outer membrane protein assembly factor BamC
MGADGVELPVTALEQPAAVLPQPSDVQVVRHGDMRWLVVKGPVEQIWPRVHEFWTKEGFEIQKEDPRVGVLETQWAENRADIPESFLRGMISKVAPNVYGAHTRDKYRARIERGAEPGTTEVFLTHYGVEQVEREEQMVWQPRASDPELVAEMMSRFMLYLGVAQERAKVALAQQANVAPRAQFDGERLLLNEGFARAWRLAGIALDRVGLVVEDLDRAKGVYYVRQSETFAQPNQEEKGWFSGWFSSDKAEDKRFRVLVQGDESATRISVQNKLGEPVATGDAKLILTRLQEQLR